MSSALTQQRRLAIVGGGLAGLAAAELASRLGLRVELLEARRQLGGRAGSFCDPHTGQWIDHAQHAALDCCIEFKDFCRRLDLAECFEPVGRLHLLGPGGELCIMAASPWLPAPLHLLPSLAQLRYLTRAQRLRTLAALARLVSGRGDGLETVGQWLARRGCSPAEQDLFWTTILCPALGELPDRLTVAAARQVFREAFFRSRRGYRFLVPRVSLAEIFDRRAAAALAARGVIFRRGAAVRLVEGDGHAVSGLRLADGSRVEADDYLVAVPWRHVKRLLAEPIRKALELPAIETIPAGAITGVHLWFDRQIAPLGHVALVGRTSQWIFQRGAAVDLCPARRLGYYYQAVLSASHRLPRQSREELVKTVCRELGDAFASAREARLLHWRVAVQPSAVFTLGPGVERLRPGQRTAVGNLLLAGDWTRTGWPATMEGAVRSGRRAVEAIS